MAEGDFRWFTDPGVIGQKFSVFAKDLPFKLGTIVSEVVDAAAEDMRGRVLQLGRIRTGDMFSSIGSEMKMNGARAAGNYGFIFGAPFYTGFQEFGTSRGILAMHAFVDASQTAQATLRARIDVVDVWRDLR